MTDFTAELEADCTRAFAAILDAIDENQQKRRQLYTPAAAAIAGDGGHRLGCYISDPIGTALRRGLHDLGGIIAQKTSVATLERIVQAAAWRDGDTHMSGVHIDILDHQLSGTADAAGKVWKV